MNLDAILRRLDALDSRVRQLEIRMAFGAGVVVAAQVIVGILL